MGKCKIDPNNPKGAKCLKRFTVKCVGKECKNYAETNFERITASPGTLAKELSTIFCNGFGRIQILEWLNQPAKEE